MAKSSLRAEAHGQSKYRMRLLSGLKGRVVEVGAGSGLNFAYYPASVREVIAIEPEPFLRSLASQAALKAPVQVRVIGGVAEDVPVKSGKFDVAVISLVLCSVKNQKKVLGELFRIIRAGGELRFYEHVISSKMWLSLLQRFVDLFIWPNLGGGCHTSRDTALAIRQAGFTVEDCESFDFNPSILQLPESPHILGTAHRALPGMANYASIP